MFLDKMSSLYIAHEQCLILPVITRRIQVMLAMLKSKRYRISPSDQVVMPLTQPTDIGLHLYSPKMVGSREKKNIHTNKNIQ